MYILRKQNSHLMRAWSLGHEGPLPGNPGNLNLSHMNAISLNLRVKIYVNFRTVQEMGGG